MCHVLTVTLPPSCYCYCHCCLCCRAVRKLFASDQLAVVSENTVLVALAGWIEAHNRLAPGAGSSGSSADGWMTGQQLQQVQQQRELAELVRLQHLSPAFLGSVLKRVPIVANVASQDALMAAGAMVKHAWRWSHVDCGMLLNCCKVECEICTDWDMHHKHLKHLKIENNSFWIQLGVANHHCHWYCFADCCFLFDCAARYAAANEATRNKLHSMPNRIPRMSVLYGPPRSSSAVQRLQFEWVLELSTVKSMIAQFK